MSRAVDRGAFAALIEHAAAFSSRDNARYAKNLSLPFVHLWPNGDLLRYDTDAELDEVEPILDWKDLKEMKLKIGAASITSR